jgi:hypothetical protein
VELPWCILRARRVLSDLLGKAPDLVCSARTAQLQTAFTFARLPVSVSVYYTASEGLTAALNIDVAVLSQTALQTYRTDTTHTCLALLFPEDGGTTILRNVGNYQSTRCHVSYDLIVERIKLRLRIQLNMSARTEGNGTGQDGTGRDRTGQHRTGRDRTGRDRTGRDGTGQDGTGRDGTGQHRTGRDGTGQAVYV